MLIFLTLMGAAVLALVVVVIYLNDRVNELERRTVASAGTPLAGSVDSGVDDGTWRGLTGKRLWDAMTGKKGVTPLDESALEALRTTYALVLSQHIESLFRAGQSDAQKGQSVQPSSVKSVSSPRGAVQSWIPLNHANALYRAGHDSTKSDIFEAERARMTLDETAQVLHAQANIPLGQPFSDLLMPDPNAASPADAAHAGQNSAPGGLPAAGAASPQALGLGLGSNTALGSPAGAMPAPGGLFAASAPASSSTQV